MVDLISPLPSHCGPFKYALEDRRLRRWRDSSSRPNCEMALHLGARFIALSACRNVLQSPARVSHAHVNEVNHDQATEGPADVAGVRSPEPPPCGS